MPDCFKKNLALIEVHHPDLIELVRTAPGPHLTLVPARTGHPALSVTTSTGEISLHSRYDPEKEGTALAGRLTETADHILVLFGLGLGYHLKAALDIWPADAPVIVVEADPDVLRLAVRHVDMTGVLDRPGLTLLVGLTPQEALKRITRLRIGYSFAPFSLLIHPPSHRWRQDYYPQIQKGLDSAGSTPIHEKLIYSRLKKERLNVLILNTGYYLTREVFQAARALGHNVRYLSLADKEIGDEDSIRRLLKETVQFRPDFILTTNHLGFDIGRVMTELLTGMKMPFASWFVDSPVFILGHAQKNLSAYCTIFLWDETYVQDVKTLGFERVHYLPLATDENVFRTLNGRPNPLAHLACEAGFVGDSMAGPVERNEKKLGIDTGVYPSIEKAAREFITSSDRSPRRMMAKNGLLEMVETERWPADKILDLEGLVTWWATKLYRLELVRSLAPLNPTVIGDKGWRDLLDPGSFKLHPSLDYYEQLPWFYPVCGINLNATSLQMKTGLNQRIFDVPACGAFLLTDYREQIEGLFEVGREVVCYRDPEEAFELADFYRKHDRERRAVAERGHLRILSEHTYRCRLGRLIEQMRRDHI